MIIMPVSKVINYSMEHLKQNLIILKNAVMKFDDMNSTRYIKEVVTLFV